MSWYNNDGLYIKYGKAKGTPAKAGEYVTNGPLRMVEVEIRLPTLVTGSTILDDTVVIPKNAFIERVQIAVDVAATSGGAATLNIGLIRTDRSTALDADGLVVAAALASINAIGNVVEYTQGSTAHGALIGTVLSNNGYLVADYDTAVYTAGFLKARVFYRFL